MAEAQVEKGRIVKELKKEFAVALLELTPDGSGQAKFKALSELLDEYGVDVKDVKTRLAQGVPLSTPTPPERDPDGLALRDKGVGSVPSPLPRESYKIGTPADVTPPLQDVKTATLRPPVPVTEVEELKRRLEAAEVKLAAQTLENSDTRDPDGTLRYWKYSSELVKLAEKQTALMERLAQPKGTQSTIKVEPKVTWPRLDDSSTGPKDAEDFFKKFEGITNLANNGTGMNNVEMLVTLRSCLGGSRLQIYENIKEVRDSDRTTQDGPRAVYVEIKQRLLKFKETQLERQIRVTREFDELHKVKI